MVVLTAFNYQLGEKPGSIRIFGTNPQTSASQTGEKPVFADATFRDAPGQPLFRIRPGMNDPLSAFCFISSKYGGQKYDPEDPSCDLTISGIESCRDESFLDGATTADSKELTIYSHADVFIAKQAQSIFVDVDMPDAHDVQRYPDVDCTVEKVPGGYRIRFVDGSETTQTFYATYTTPGSRATFAETTGGFPSWTKSIPKGYRTALRTQPGHPLWWRDPEESEDRGRVWTGLTMTSMVPVLQSAEGDLPPESVQESSL